MKYTVESGSGDVVSFTEGGQGNRVDTFSYKAGGADEVGTQITITAANVDVKNNPDQDSYGVTFRRLSTDESVTIAYDVNE